MPYVSAKEMILDAKAKAYAVAHFNLNNMESIRAFLLAAENCSSPVILAVSGGTAKYMGGYATVYQTVTSFMDFLKTSVPVALHVDHGTFEQALEAIDAGFRSVMFDGSKMNFRENLAKSRELRRICARRSVSLECEIGAIGEEEGTEISMGELADPDECAQMAELGIDMLAAGIGNIHGNYPRDWQGLNFEVLGEIARKTAGLPLVLHGGSGIPDDSIKRAVSLGVRKINVNSECQQVFYYACKEFIMEHNHSAKSYSTRAFLNPAVEALMMKAREKMTLFGSVERA